jgi:putative photosynthetic complex assembly protein
MNEKAFPKYPLYSAAVLIGSALLLVVAVKVTGKGDLRTPQMTVVSERLLHFEDQADGSIIARDASDEHVLEVVAPGTNGFLRGTLRGLARERHRQSIGPEIAFRLTGRSDGRLLLEDPATHRLVDLGSFGPTNAAVFARLLTEKPVAPTANTGQATPPPGNPGDPAAQPLAATQ